MKNVNKSRFQISGSSFLNFISTQLCQFFEYNANKEMPWTVRSNPVRCGKPQIPGQQCRFTWRYSRGGILTGSWCVSCHRNVTKTLKRSKIHVSRNITDSTQRQQRPHANCGSQNLFTLVWAHFPEWSSHAISAIHWIMIVNGGFVSWRCVKSNLTWCCPSLSS